MFRKATYKNMGQRLPLAAILVGLLIVFAGLPAHAQFIHQLSSNGSSWADKKLNGVEVNMWTDVFVARGGTKLLTTDPLTGLPLYPATDSRLHLGNEPTRLPESQVCKSKMQGDFYSVYDSRVNATLAWYDAHLPGFKKTHAYAANRSQDTFYKSDGAVLVSVTGSTGKEGENTDTYSVLYVCVHPGLPEKTIVGLNQQNLVCP
jgi:hypothetical protein